MGMSAQVRGINSGSLIPAPNFLIAKDAEGKYTASRDFSALKGSSVTWAISKGTPISSLCTDLPPEFSFLQVESFESRDAPGGITVVSVNFTGSPEDDEFGFDREITYSIRGTTFRRPILEHPTFIEDMEGANDTIRSGFVAILSGEAYAKGTSASNYQIIRITPNEEIVGSGGWIENETNTAWWDIIVKKGLKDYDAASLEWTKSTSNAAGLTNADIAKLAKSDEPPGGPPTPEEPGWWQMVDLSDERSSNQSSNSVTWRYVYGVKIPKLHDYEEE
jgi:hypothetical protein